MRAPHLSTLAAIALTIVAAHASAQSTKPVGGSTDPRQVAIGYPSPVDSRADAAARATELANRLTARIADADSLFTAGNFDAARRAFKDVSLTLEKNGMNPAIVQRRLANVEFAMDNVYAAATTLEDVAFSAGRFGDPATQLGALVDATLLYVDLGRRDRQAELVRLIRPLLKRTEIPEQVRLNVARMLHIW